VLLGAVTASSAIVWAHGCNAGAPAFDVKCSHGAPLSSRAAQGDMFYTLDNGWAGSAQIDHLQPLTTYGCAVNVEGKVTTLSLTTFPAFGAFGAHNASETLDIVHGSCSSVSIWPWNSLASSFNAVAKINPRFIFLLGDNAYTDLTEYLPWYRKTFDAAHRNVLRQPAVTRVLQQAPSFVMFDDHEIENDFEGGLAHPLALIGLSKYVAYWGQRNPGRPRNPASLYYSFDYGSLVSVFVMDARAHSNWTAQEMIGKTQFKALETFLVRAKSLGFRFVILASPLSWSEDGSGSYFVSERRRLLDLIVDELDMCNVIVVSGLSSCPAN